ncbi:Carnitine O-acetyltransferase-like isoform X1 [Oopsacas minuta]|uniref:Carnitine O-acetyltransferase-like isoform X1 n=1 Tax=Oopsacas minuta TaxID=111878 RepID=A0AAV7K1S1_9METZ|nr:Carnitine O-acetyltransferase-like isoform X1 [Oopsacas minuta]
MSQHALLPKMPVPTLADTLKRFLTALKPLLTYSKFEETVRKTDSFAKEHGPYLQDKLVKLSEEVDNWAGYVSVHVRYLANRSPLILTNGAGATFVPAIGSPEESILTLLSYYIAETCALNENIRNHKLPQQMFDNEPLCMAQYNNLFCSCRIPGIKIDTFKHSPHSKHIVVMYAGSMYKVPMYSGDKLINLQEIHNLLSQVLEQREEGKSVGLLTALDRDTWYTTRAHLKLSPINTASLEIMEGCIIVISIDDFGMANLSHGDKLKYTIFCDFENNFPNFNRWYGTSLQTIISKDGYFCSTNEHSLFDGTIGSDRDQYDPVTLIEDSEIQSNLKIELLQWEISPFIQSKIDESRLELSKISEYYDTKTFNFPDYGRDFFSNHGLYYQGYMQLAFQLAYFKLYNRLCPSYQPVSLRKYRGGRLEHPHVVSEESKAFVEAMVNSQSSSKDKYKLMNLALNRHKELMADASQGQAYCKHLLGLKMLAEEENMNLEIFQDECFNVFTQHNLATSGMPIIVPILSNHPVHSGNGHFVVFKPENESLNYNVTTLVHSSEYTNSTEFGSAIAKSLIEIKRLVLAQATDGILQSKL